MKADGGKRTIEGHVLVCFPLKEEAAPFRKIAGGLRQGRLITILLTGIGHQNAEKSVREFFNSCRSRGNETQIHNQSETPHVVSYDPHFVLTCGFAGGLNPDLKLGDVVFEFPPGGSRRKEAQTEVGNRQSAIGTELDPSCVGCYEKLIAAGGKPAKFFSADRVATTVAEKKKLRAETGADAVEMESAAIHAVCAEHGIPCATVRVISDTANDDLPLDFNRLSKPDKSLDYGKLFLAVARSPGKIGALMKLQKQTQFAAERLTEVLGMVLSLPG
jgi:adenosylhomocysteine nucleosidase